MIHNSLKQKSSLIGLTKITSSNGQQSVLALDSCGIINQWFINDSLFNNSIENKVNDIEDIYNISKKVIYPHKAYKIHHTPFDMNLTSIKASNDIVFITGESETIGINSRKFSNDLKQNDNHHQSSSNSNRIKIESITSDITLKDNQNNRSLINGIDFNNQSGHMITYSNNGIIYMFDMQKYTLINTNRSNNNDSNQSNNGYYYTKHSISSAKLFDNNQIVYGGNNSKLTFLSSNKMEYIGDYDIYSNHYSSFDSNTTSQSQLIISNKNKPYFDVTCLHITPNYLLASCNNFILKYSLALNLCTNILQTNYTINSFTKTDTDILIASDNNHILKFPNDKLKPILIETSSSSLSSIEFIHFPYSSNSLLIAGGDSNVIDIINNEIVCSLIF